jgi:hypothetical protein
MSQIMDEINLSRAIRIYWCWLWRSLLGAILFALIIGFLVGFVGSLSGIPRGLVRPMAGPLGGLIGLIWTIFCLRMALRKKYKGFRLAVVSTGGG